MSAETDGHERGRTWYGRDPGGAEPGRMLTGPASPIARRKVALLAW